LKDDQVSVPLYEDRGYLEQEEPKIGISCRKRKKALVATELVGEGGSVICGVKGNLFGLPAGNFLYIRGNRNEEPEAGIAGGASTVLRTIGLGGQKNSKYNKEKGGVNEAEWGR